MMEYIIEINQLNRYRIDPRGYIWQFDGEIARQIDVEDKRDLTGGHEDILHALKRARSMCAFHRLTLEPGQYYPYMARPTNKILNGSGTNPDYLHLTAERVRRTGQLHALIVLLENICRVVQPEKRNQNAFGHEIRNVLLVACTEVEAHWKKIYHENGGIREDPKTKQYIVLADAMRLREYGVSFPWFPWLKSIKPFKSWDRSKGESKSLPWYAAYNAVDLEKSFHRATLLRAFEAVAACFVMLCAQYGIRTRFPS
jgi:hypothetical protein